jgi:hypothetical protein
MNRTLRVLVTAILPASIVFSQGKQPMTKTYDVDGHQVKCIIEEYSPPLVVKNDQKLMNKLSPVSCSHLFYSLLAAGDIDGAAVLSNDPEKTRTKYTRQMDRTGQDEFKKMFAAYFSGSAKVRYCFSLGDHSMIIVRSNEMGMDIAQFYVKAGKQFLVEEKESKERDQLGKIYGQLKDEEGNVIVK